MVDVWRFENRLLSLGQFCYPIGLGNIVGAAIVMEIFWSIPVKEGTAFVFRFPGQASVESVLAENYHIARL